MSIDTTPDSGATEEIAELERKVAELRTARAQMVAEREEHIRNAARAAAVLGGLAQIHRELGILASERAAARDAADAKNATAAAELERVTRASATAEAGIADLEARLAIARETIARLNADRAEAERVAGEATVGRDLAFANYEETARAAADVTQKYEAAVADSTIAEGRDVQFTDIEETLDREQILAETRLRDARARAETMQVEADLRRIRELEDRLAVERADLERRLRAMRSSAVVASPTPTPTPTPIAQSVVTSPPIVIPAMPASRVAQPSATVASIASPTREGAEPQRVSLAARLLRDLAKPSSRA